MGTLAQACPGCGQRLTKGQVVCVSCGYHLADDRKLDTKVTRVKERVLARRAKRRAASIGVRLIPHGVTLAQTCAILLVVFGDALSLAPGTTAIGVLRAYILIGGIVVSSYATLVVGPSALLFRSVVVMVLIADDANPYIMGIFFNMGVSLVLMLLMMQGSIG